MTTNDVVPPARYTVVSIDNASFVDGGLRMTKREFNDSREALTYAERLVDGALEANFADAKSAHELMSRYTVSGSDVPKIYGEPRLDFHAYRYAREKAEAMFSIAPD